MCSFESLERCSDLPERSVWLNQIRSFQPTVALFVEGLWVEPFFWGGWIKHPIQTQAFAGRGDDAVRALLGGEDLADVVGAEAAAADGVQCTGEAAHHFVQKTGAFDREG